MHLLSLVFIDAGYFWVCWYVKLSNRGDQVIRCDCVHRMTFSFFTTEHSHIRIPFGRSIVPTGVFCHRTETDVLEEVVFLRGTDQVVLEIGSARRLSRTHLP